MTVLIILMPSFIALAQNKPGRWAFGIDGSSDLGFSRQSSNLRLDGTREEAESTTIGLAPQVGYLPVKNLVVGLGSNLAYSSTLSYPVKTMFSLATFGPFFKCYFSDGKLKPFFGFNFEYGIIKGKEWALSYFHGLLVHNPQPANMATLDVSFMRANAGVAWFLTRSFSVEAGVFYFRIDTDDRAGNYLESKGLNSFIGLNFYI